MRIRLFALAVAAFGLLAAAPANAALLITVDKSAQRMTVELDGQPIFDWPVSTGTRGHDTPGGDYKPFRMEKDHFSREWDDAPMPNSIFFTMQGHAIHGSSHVKALGTPASHGCVRLSVENSEMLWRLVKQEKMANTRVVLLGEAPAPPPPMASEPDSRPALRNPRTATRETDDPSFTDALPPPQRRYRGPDGAAYFDGRYFYDRRGRRLAEAEPRDGRWTYGRDPYYDAPQPRTYRREGFFRSWN